MLDQRMAHAINAWLMPVMFVAGEQTKSDHSRARTTLNCRHRINNCHPSSHNTIAFRRTDMCEKEHMFPRT